MKKTKIQNIANALLGVILLCIIVMAFVRYSQKIQVNIDQYATTTLNEFAVLQKNAIYSKLTSNMNLLKNISALLESEDNTFTEAVDILQNSKINHEFYQLALFDKDGMVATTDNSEIEISFEDISYQFNTHESTFYNPIQSRIDGDFILTMSYPVYDKEHQQVQYVLVGLNTLEVLQSYIENTFDENGNIGVLNSNGELIFSNQLTQKDVSIRQNYLNYFFARVNTTFTEEQLYSEIEMNRSGVFMYKYGANEIFFQYIPLEINDWFLVLHVNKNSLASRVNLGTTDALLFLVIFGVCIFILAGYIYIVNNRVKKELYDLAFYDKLTKLPNGENFRIESNRILEKNTGTLFFCIVFDICNFKLINDRFGSAAGDKVLCSIADILKKTIDSFPTGMATLAKLHSDTFVILMPTSTEGGHVTHIFSLIEQIRTATDFIGDYKLDLSLGRYFTQPDDAASTVLERALTAHSHAKRVAPNQFVNFDNVFIRSLHTRADILNSFDDAIANDEFHIYFQPQFSATTKKIQGAEILVRWIKDGAIKYTPDCFVPVLEEAGRISALDSYLREKLCITIRKWLNAKLQLPHFSVNVSRIELKQPNFIPDLQKLLDKYDISPSMIHIEVTETAYIGNHEYLVNKIIALQECGFMVEMDDFGSGYSSLNVLKDIPIDIIKLDMKFIEDSANATRSGNILSSVVRMAQGIHLITIAEGVETKEQVDYLESIGCDYLQGYYFAKPMSADDFIEMLQNHHISAELHSLENLSPNASVDFWDIKTQENLVFNSFVGCALIVEYCNDSLIVLRANEKIYEVLGVTKEQFSPFNQNIFDKISPDYLSRFKENVLQIIETKGEISGEICGYPLGEEVGVLRWQSYTIQYLSQAGNRHIFFFHLSDITKQKELEQKLQLLDMDEK
ncbi:MAG: EAL domain-containing protein [Lachnospiraceae bacterium]